jgi:hypothetical protein
MSRNINIEAQTWKASIQLAAKLIRYAKQGYTKAEKQEIIADLLELILVFAKDIGDDV